MGTRAAFDFGAYVFYQVLKQDESYAVKSPIGFRGLIYGIMICERHYIINSEDVEGANVIPLTYSYRLSRTHVLDMSIPNIHFDLTNEGDLPEVPPMSSTSKRNVLLDLM